MTSINCFSLNFASVKQSSGVIHSIDPFKVELFSALEKLQALKDIASPFAIVASTDFDPTFNLDFYLKTLSSVGLPLLTHFLPNCEGRVPVFEFSNGAILTVLANSEIPAYSNPEAIYCTQRFYSRDSFVPVRTVGLALGEDIKSRDLAGATFVNPTINSVSSYLSREVVRTSDAFYLYSRNEPIEPTLVRYMRLRLPSHCIFFVSGCVKSGEQAHALLDAGAQYVVVGSALEHPDWRRAFESIFVYQHDYRKAALMRPEIVLT